MEVLVSRCGLVPSSPRSMLLRRDGRRCVAARKFERNLRGGRGSISGVRTSAHTGGAPLSLEGLQRSATSFVSKRYVIEFDSTVRREHTRFSRKGRAHTHGTQGASSRRRAALRGRRQAELH